MNVSVLGCGRWGSFLAWYNRFLGHKVINWGPAGSESYEVLKNTGKNEYVTLNRGIELTDDLERAVSNADVIIVSISAQSLREFLGRVTAYDLAGKRFVLCMKGIEEETGKRLSEVAIECGIDRDKVAVWVGPGHIQEFVKKTPNCMVIDSYDPQLKVDLAHLFKSGLIRFYYGSDIIGTEVGAATKNVMGIVAGVLDGMGLVTLKGALMARGSREVARLIKAMGGNEFSAYGLCHLGDYETTLFSEHSHNRKWGELYCRGQRFGKLAEGVPTAHAIAKLAGRLGVDMPITNAVNDMIRKNIPPRAMLEELFGRDLKEEFYD